MIQTRQIEAFRTVMLTGTMTTAAEMIQISQPAASRLVRDLERQPGLTLFRRRGNLVVPTHEATALLTEVERSFVGLAQISAFADDLRRGRTGSLRVAALPTMAAASRRASSPNSVAGSLVSKWRSTACRRKRSGIAGRYDIGVATFPFRHGSLAVIPLEDKAAVALPVGHRLAAHRVVRPEDLQQENLILLTRLASGQQHIAAVLQSARARQVIETSLSSIACVFVSEGMGIAIVDPFSVSEFVGRNVLARPLEPSFNIGTAILRSTERPLSMVADEFRTAFLDHIHRFLQRADYLQH